MSFVHRFLPPSLPLTLLSFRFDWLTYAAVKRSTRNCHSDGFSRLFCSDSRVQSSGRSLKGIYQSGLSEYPLLATTHTLRHFLTCFFFI